MVCPKCKVEGPKSQYCLYCGYPLYLKEIEPSKLGDVEGIGMEAASEPVKTEPLSGMPQAREVEEAVEVPVVEAEKPEVIEIPEVIEVQEEHIVYDQASKQAAELATTFEVNPVVKEAMENLMRSISLRFWLVNLLLEGKIKEEHFNRLFESNKTRLKICMDRRNEMLKRARDLDSTEKALNEVKVNLAELEMKKAIGDISEKEYEAKAPAIKWDIGKYVDEISKRKIETVLLEDLTCVMSLEKIAQMKEMAANCRGAVQMCARSLEKSCNISSETASMVKTSLKETLVCLEDLRCL